MHHPRTVRALLAAITLYLANGPAANAATAVVDTTSVHQTIRGFGGATVFQPPNLPASLTPSELDTLFGTGPNQIGLTLLRIRVAEDDAWRAVELAHAQGAKARGAAVIATPWSPPAAMKSNNSLISGRLLPANYAAYATYLNDFARYMARNGASLYAISIQNEPDYQVTYESCDWTPAEMLEFCRDHAGAINATRVMMPESFQFRHNMSDSTLNDDAAAANIDLIGGHIYGGGLAPYPLAVAKGKEVWMTEHLDLLTDWTGALATAREIHECLATAGFNAYIWWYARRFYGPLGENGIVTKRGHVMAQFTRFIRPGYVRVGATANPTPGMYVSAYQRDKLVIVAINTTAAAINQGFAIQPASVPTVTPWTTSSTLDMATQATIGVTGGTFSASLPPQSITTFVGDLAFPPPSIVTSPQAMTVITGSTAVLEVTAAGDYPTYQWYRNNAALPGATSRLLTITDAQAGDAGAYIVTVSNSGGSVTSASASLSVVSSANPGQLINISTRAPVGTGADVLIAGFVISGTNPKPVLMRAAGPALNASFGLPGVLADPFIEVHAQATGTVIASNDDWDAALAPSFSAVNAFSWPTGSKDAALLATLAPGAYTAIVRGQNNTTGIAIAEVYDTATATPDSILINISARALVGTGDNVPIAGFVIGGTTARTVVIRASGPALNELFDLPGVLTDPTLQLVNQSGGATIATAEDWEPELAPHFAAVNAFAWNDGSKDAALVTTLAPGAYTVIVRGRNNATGVTLVEVYERP